MNKQRGDIKKSQKLKKTKGGQKLKKNLSSPNEEGEGDSIEDAQININDDDDDEYDDEEAQSEDHDFIAPEQEVINELSEQKRRERKEFKREQKKQRKLNRERGDMGVDDEDIELIQDSKIGRLRKLRKTGPESDEYDEQEDKSQQQNFQKKKKGQQYDLKREYEDPYYAEKVNKGDIKRQMQEKRGNDSTAAEDDGHQTHLHTNQSLKDKFVCEDIDDLFGTKNDMEIAEKDCPERIQIRLSNRLNPTEQEIEVETDWIFSQMITNLAASKGHMELNDFQNIKTKISKTLKFFRCENKDIPFICKYEMNQLTPELEQDDIWKIFNMDIEYGKFQIQKKHCEDFFTKISEIGSANGNAVHMEHYKNQIHHVKNQRDLNDFQPLINFYKSFYQKELEQVANKSGKKLPVPKREFVFNARQKRLDQFSRRCLLSPIQIVENISEDKQMHKPPQPNVLAVDMAKEYANPKLISDNKDNTKKQMDIYLEVLKEMCLFAASELQSQPDIRRALKKHIYDNGILQTHPTEKGKKELDVFHPSYRVKRLNKRLNEIKQNDLCATDVFLDVLQNESLGLITYEIVIKDDCEDTKIGNKFFQNMYEKYKYPDDSSQWNLVRREIFQLFSSINSVENKGQKSFLSSIKEEIKEELKEDAETYILSQCGDKYRQIIETGYFKIDERMIQKEKKVSENDVVPQRERLTVLGAVMHQIDMRTNLCQIAVVDQFGELKEHHTFYHIIPPRKKRQGRDGVMPPARPGEAEEENKHKADKERFKNVLRDFSVDLIVVCADCLEAKKLKKTLEEFANLRGQNDNSDNDNDDDKDMNQDEDDMNQKEANVIWGRPEIPKLFASSHYSQKLLKGQPFILKKAICLARYEQDPMNEVVNLWSPIQSENQALHLNLHPNQKHINQSRLMDILEEINIKTVNNVGIDINMLSDHEHWYNQLQFLSGLGPRKAQKFLQKLKSLGQPLQTRTDIHSQKILKKNCFESALAFIKIRVKNSDGNQKQNILDQTRIHIKFYDKVYKLVTDFMFENQPDIEEYKKQAAVVDLIKNPEKLKEFSEGQYKEELKKIDNPHINQLTFIYHSIMEELLHPFIDPREAHGVVRTINEQRFQNEELFYSLIDETQRTFKKGMIVSATVVRVFESNPNADRKMDSRILCRLENGLDANIYERDTDQLQNLSNVDVGSIITGRIDNIKFATDPEKPNDDTFSINLNLKKKNLVNHDEYIEGLNIDGDIPEEDMINMNFKTQEDQIQNQQKHMIQKRKIQHQRFQNIASRAAINLLMKEDIGEFYFRPSSKGDKNITLTWKFFEGNIVHIDIKELEKAPGANIGSKLQISDEIYENLQEIVERYILPCNRSLREVTNHQKFQKCNDLDELKKCLEAEKADDNSRIPYKFTVLEKYPQYLILAYIPKKDIVKEFIKVKPRGYFFHHQYHYPFQNMINWFKEQFRTKDYQRYLRKTGSPQMAIGGVQPQKPQQNNDQHPSNMPYKSGMQIDQGNRQEWGGADGNDVKHEGSRYGQRRSPGGANWGENSRNDNDIKDEREKAGGAWGGDAGSGNWGGGDRRRRDDDNMQSPDSDRGGFRGRGRGRDDRGGRGGGGGFGDRPPMKCFNCDQEGHRANDCTEPRKERGGGRGPMKCFNCDQEGHRANECTEPRKEREGGRGPMKCYNCQGEGHMANNCTEERQERRPRDNFGGDRDDRPAYKRQRNDDEDFRQKDTQSTWTKQGGQEWGNNANAGGSQNNWNAEAAKNTQQNSQEGWGGAASQTGNPKKSSQDEGFGNAGQSSAGGWGNETQ